MMINIFFNQDKKKDVSNFLSNDIIVIHGQHIKMYGKRKNSGKMKRKEVYFMEVDYMNSLILVGKVKKFSNHPPKETEFCNGIVNWQTSQMDVSHSMDNFHVCLLCIFSWNSQNKLNQWPLNWAEIETNVHMYCQKYWIKC